MKDPILRHTGGTKIVTSCTENCVETDSLEADDRFLDFNPRAVAPQANLGRRGVSASASLTHHQFDKAFRVLRIKQLMERTMLSRATLYALMSNDPSFPRKIKLTARSVGWLESEIDGWIAARAESRNAA